MSEVEKLRDALSRIADISRAAFRPGHETHGHGDDRGDDAGAAICTPKSLPLELQVRAAQTATQVNPVNAPAFALGPRSSDALLSLVNDPLQIAVLTSKYWGPSRRRLSVSFLDSPSAELRKRILHHLNAWKCGVEFVSTTGVGQVRISRGPGGYWSYVGTDILHIATDSPTMNLEGFTLNTPEQEYRRVVSHEGGHTLGFPHEHMRRELVNRIDREKAYEYFGRTQGWTREMVNQQVLTPLDERSIMATPPDETSIMCYQLPAEITRDGGPILGGLQINGTDRAFARRIYPPPAGGNTAARGVETEPPPVRVEYNGFVHEPVFVD